MIRLETLRTHQVPVQEPLGQVDLFWQLEAQIRRPHKVWKTSLGQQSRLKLQQEKNKPVHQQQPSPESTSVTKL